MKYWLYTLIDTIGDFSFFERMAKEDLSDPSHEFKCAIMKDSVSLYLIDLDSSKVWDVTHLAGCPESKVGDVLTIPSDAFIEDKLVTDPAPVLEKFGKLL